MKIGKITGKKDAYHKLKDNVSETDSDGPNRSSNNNGETADDSKYNEADYRYNLIDKDNKEKVPEKSKPVKGYYYLSFTVIMILILLVAVILEVWDPDKYIKHRNS